MGEGYLIIITLVCLMIFSIMISDEDERDNTPPSPML